MKPMLYLLMGLPGAGKTTTAKILEVLTGATRLTSDEQRLKLWSEPTFSEEEHAKLYTRLNQKTRDLLEGRKSVIYDANLNRKIHRQEKYKIASQVNAEVVLLVIQTSVEVARQRAVFEADGKENRVFGNLDQAVFDRLKNEIEWPAEDEPHIVLDGTHISAAYVAEKLEL